MSVPKVFIDKCSLQSLEILQFMAFQRLVWFTKLVTLKGLER